MTANAYLIIMLISFILLLAAVTSIAISLIKVTNKVVTINIIKEKGIGNEWNNN